ncbi:hypothetical protein GLOIN_2v1791704 [Rhizophagus irregularis DAOM 181602=DAOM 197198]|nr:hypothetical protein GLOIN_2v1791704 [Rhizophagus irregularis DAOM 181602=DAOM 197198]
MKILEFVICEIMDLGDKKRTERWNRKIGRSDLFKDKRMLRRLKIEMIRWMNDMFRLGGTVCKDCEEEDIDEIDGWVKDYGRYSKK